VRKNLKISIAIVEDTRSKGYQLLDCFVENLSLKVQLRNRPLKIA